MSVDMSQFHGVFFEESQEHLDEMEHLLMNLDLDTPDPEDLNSIFRAAHSIKGGSGIFGFDALTGLTHVMENLLDKARKSQLTMTTEIVDIMLHTVDTLKSILESYREETPIDWEVIESGTQKLESILAPESTSIEGEDEGFGLFESEPVHQDDAFGFFDEETGGKQKVDQADEEDDAFGFFTPLESTPESAEPQQNLDQDGAFGFFEPIDKTDSQPEVKRAEVVEQPPAAPDSQTHDETKRGKKTSSKLPIRQRRIKRAARFE